MAIICLKCGAENTSDSNYCKSCATQLLPSKESQVSVTVTLETPKEELTTGFTFADRYQIIEELGQGGMGRVYKALDKEVNERIAIKLLRPEIAADSKTIERFRNELKFSRKIGHKNVCRMYDLNKEENTYYITMEYVPGEDLKSFIKRSKQLTPSTIISIGKQVCEGLSEAHRLGVVHRDLKPQNIMIDKEGNARIMDFGIARSLRGKGVTAEGVIIGTPEYMSPEQVEAKDIDERSDIYSLGVVLYEMAAGHVPFEGETALSVAMKHKGELPKNPREFNPQIPGDLCLIVLKCLEKDKDRRYQSADELLNALKRFEESQTDRTQISEWKTSIAVLPFKNMSADPEQEYFCEGLAEELINAFAQMRDLRVVARTSAFSFKGKDIDIRDIGRKLNVETVLEGSVRKAGNRLRVTAQLINVADGFHLWSNRFDRELEDIFAIQDDIAQSIIKELKIEILGAEEEPLVKVYTENTEAYEAYLKGRFHLFKFTHEHFDIALEYFHLALEKYPDYALAYAGIAFYWLAKANLGFAALRESFLKSKEAALKAIELDDSLAEAHEVLAAVSYYYEWDWKKTEEEYKRTIELNPNLVNARLMYAEFLSSMRHPDEAMAEIERALELDPLNHFPQQMYGGHLLQAHRYDDAIAQFKKTLKMEPSFFVAHERLWVAFHQKGMDEKALAEAKTYFTKQGMGEVAEAITRGDADGGYPGAMRQAAEALEECSKKIHVLATRIALVYAHAKEIDRALEWLEKAYKEHEPLMVYLGVDIQWDPLRDDPRFQELLSRMNFPE
ncbi:MAG: protein kinase [Candidatus Aminicenantes bacterium]|jgi:serine/threonine-protein kinase|nr:protein kinase [Candidatus Aminicenantes bacterium]